MKPPEQKSADSHESMEKLIRERCRENAQLICDQSKGAFPVVDGMEDLLYSLVKGLVYTAIAHERARLNVSDEEIKMMAKDKYPEREEYVYDPYFKTRRLAFKEGFRAAQRILEGKKERPKF